MKILTTQEMADLSVSLRDPIEYRKSGLSLNHIIGCPLDCAYCVRHLFDNFRMKTPTALYSDEDAVRLLTSHRFFVPHRTPLQIFNRATDPLLPSVKPHLFRVLELLDAAGYRNHLLIISRFVFEAEDADRLNRLVNLRVTLLFTYSGIADTRIEPIDSGIAERSLKLAHSLAKNYRVILYWRPLVPGLNDSDEHIRKIQLLSANCHAVVFTGLFYRKQIRDFFHEHGIADPHTETARRKILPHELEQRILSSFHAAGLNGKIFRKTSCGVAFAHSVADYNGHYCIREICDICPVAQVERCASEHRSPPLGEISDLAAALGADSIPEITDRAVLVTGLDEQRRYFLQHRFGFQVHDRRHPHKIGRHGRADVGWMESNNS
jgi:DNA repair photolyase